MSEVTDDGMHGWTRGGRPPAPGLYAVVWAGSVTPLFARWYAEQDRWWLGGYWRDESQVLCFRRAPRLPDFVAAIGQN